MENSSVSGNFLLVTEGDEVRARRKRIGWTQQDLASAARVSVKQVSNLERGENVTIEFLRKLHRAMDEVEGPDVPVSGIVDFYAGKVTAYLTAEVACGEPMDHSVEGDAVLVESDFPPRNSNEYMVRARGDSMVQFEIEDGDVLVIEKRPNGIIASGEIVLAHLNGGVTVKAWERRKGRVYLRSGSDDVADQEITEQDELDVRGVVKRRYRPDVKHFRKLS